MTVNGLDDPTLNAELRFSCAAISEAAFEAEVAPETVSATTTVLPLAEIVILPGVNTPFTKVAGVSLNESEVGVGVKLELAVNVNGPEPVTT